MKASLETNAILSQLKSATNHLHDNEVELDLAEVDEECTNLAQTDPINHYYGFAQSDISSVANDFVS